jgi:hypothetical protein
MANAAVSARMVAEHHRSAYRYLADHHRGPGWAPLRLALRAGLGTRAALAVRRSRQMSAPADIGAGAGAPAGAPPTPVPDERARR